MTMISRGVEISIAGGGGVMVCGPIAWSEPSSFYRHLHATLTLVTHDLVLHKLLWLIVSQSARSIDDSQESSRNIPFN